MKKPLILHKKSLETQMAEQVDKTPGLCCAAVFLDCPAWGDP